LFESDTLFPNYFGEDKFVIIITSVYRPQDCLRDTSALFTNSGISLIPVLDSVGGKGHLGHFL